MKVLTRKDINKKNLWRYLIYGWLPIPQSIIPPERPYYLWRELNSIPHDSAHDYNGKLLDEMRGAIRRSLRGWEPIDRIGVWISGGVDSSVLLSLTSEIIGSEKVIAYCLSFGERDESRHAIRISDWCRVKLVTKEMTPNDGIRLTEEAVKCMRAPVDSAAVLFISKLCKHDGTKKIFSGLGLDELLGGYPMHARASNKNFFRVETELLWRCQSSYVWMQLAQSKKYVEVRFPFLDSDFIAFCRGLPKSHKCVGQETKIRLRNELHHKGLIPVENIEAGRIAGTKGGFIPVWEDWFTRGYDEWCNENIPPKSFGLADCLITKLVLRMGHSLEGKLQRRIRIAAVNTFYSLLDDGSFRLQNDGEYENSTHR